MPSSDQNPSTKCCFVGFLRRLRRPKRSPTSFHRLSSSSFATLEMPTQLKQVFRLIDANGDGKISPLELGDVLLRLGHEKSAAAREAEGMVREADCNGDGFIDLEEFMEAVVGGGGGGESAGGPPRTCVISDEDLVEAFHCFDADGDGFISAGELRRVLVGLGLGRCSLRECRHMIRGVDKNGDGQVDFEEFRSMMTHAGRGSCEDEPKAGS